jgi:excisionase family DNA binding protein
MSTATAHATPGEVLTVEQVADLLGLGRNTVYDAANRGEIPHRRIGRRLIFSRVAVLEWLAGKGPANT